MTIDWYNFYRLGQKQQIGTMTIEWDKDNNNMRKADGDHWDNNNILGL